MTRLTWDQVGTRTFETGCDRGVLFLSDGTAVAWSGLTSCGEDSSDITLEEYYLDGVKYLNRRTPGDYSGTLKALTYPDEFLEFDGYQLFDAGLYAADQEVTKTFGLSYRTRVGNDEDIEAGYKIHLLYNLSAKPDTRSYNTQTATTVPQEFGWTLTGVPVTIPGLRPSAHIVIDSTKTPPTSLTIFEDFIYGTDDIAGSLPTPELLMTMPDDIIVEPISGLI